MSFPGTFGSSSSFCSSSSSSSSFQGPIFPISNTISISSSSSSELSAQEKKESKEEKAKEDAKSNISVPNRWLLRSIDTDPDAIEETLKNGADINIMTEEGTPLCRAVKHKKEIAALKLLEHKDVDINLVDRGFQTPIELAATTGQVILLKSSLEKRQWFNEKTFDVYLKHCVDNYNEKPGKGSEQHNHAMIAHYVSRFTGTNVGKLLAENHNQERYVVHLYAFETAVHDRVPLVGWQAQEFLPLRIYSFFEILVKLMRGVIYSESPEKSKFSQDQIKNEIQINRETLRTVQDRLAIDQIENEIKIARETLRNVQDRLAIEKFHNAAEKLAEEAERLAEEKESKASNGKEIPSMPHSRDIEISEESEAEDESKETEAKDIPIEDKDIFQQVEDLYEVLARRIITRAGELKENQSYPVSIGFKDHEIYLNFMRYGDHILIRVDNLGYGNHRHPSEKGKSLLGIKPYQLHSVLAEDLSTDKDLLIYMTKVLKTKNREELKLNEKEGEKHREELLDDIYDALISDKQSFKGEWPQTSAQRTQTGGNCVLESQQIGLFLRSYDKGFFKWLLNLERQCVVNHDRVKFAKKANEEKYWEEKQVHDEAISKARWFSVFAPFSIEEALVLLFEAWAILLTGRQSIYAEYIDTKKARLQEKEAMEVFSMFEESHEEILPEPIFSFLMAYENKDYVSIERLKKQNQELLKKHGQSENPSVSRLLRLLDISILLLRNAAGSIHDYKPCIEKIKSIESTCGSYFFFQLIKGLLHLNSATRTISRFEYIEAMETLLPIVEAKGEESIHVSVRFLAHFAIGICGYHLKDYLTASAQLQHALGQLVLYKNLHSDVAASYKQHCLTYLGYLSIEREEWREADKCFNGANHVSFTAIENTGISRIDPHRGISRPIYRTVQVTRPTTQILLGLALVNQHSALSSQLASEQKKYFETAEKYLKKCLSMKDAGLQKIIEEKLQEIQKQLSSIKEKDKGTKRKSEEMASGSVSSSSSSFSSSTKSLDADDAIKRTKEPRLDQTSLSASTSSGDASNISGKETNSLSMSPPS